MTRTLAKTLMALCSLSGVATCAFAQDPNPPPGWEICIDPANTQPYSNDFIANSRANELFRATVGGGGTVTYGGQNSPCWNTQRSYNSAGRIGFASGPTGSVQSSIDDDMMYTFGMPFSPAGTWSYASTRRRDPNTQAVTSTLFGSALSGNFFAGASGRYIYVEQTADNILTAVRVDVVGDAARVRWQMTNLQAAAQQLGIWYGAIMAMLPLGGNVGPGGGVTGFLGDANVFINIPGRKPLRVDTRIRRTDNPSNFPPFVQFCYGQTNAYGLQVDLGPTEATSDNTGQNSDATNVDELVVGSAGFVLGSPVTQNDVNPMPDFIFGDVFLGSEQFIVKYEPQTGGTVAQNANRTIISYFRNTWGNSKYTRPSPIPNRPSDQPYTTVVDAPHLLVQDDNGTGTNGLGNNPFTVRVYVDNVGGYSDIDTGVELNDVRVRLNLPPGMTILNGDSAEKVITSIEPIQVQFVEWQCESDGIEIGDLPYSVTVTSIPGPNQPITHNGIIRVSATKQVKLQPAANLISTPWVFADSSWEAVLGMTSPADFTAYDWDPAQNSYVISTSAARGKGTWIILNPATHPSEEVRPYFGAASPPDIQSGAPNLQLKSGWNLIGNPYPYALPIAQLVGVSAANPAQSFSFADLISQNVVSPFLAYWDPAVNNYRFIQGITAIMQPNRGYWIKVQTAQDLTLNFPPIFDTFVPGGRANSEPAWVQTSDHWRLNLKAKSNAGEDVENFIGVALGSQTNRLQIPEPPQGPTQDVTVSMDGAIANQNVRLAQALSNRAGQLEYRVFVQSKNGGPTTLSWPNMASLPRNLAFRIVDATTRQSLDMRSRSSLSFNAQPNSTREFRVQTNASASTLPVIGTVTAGSGRISTHTPVTVKFALNYDANVTVRVLNNQGTQIAVVRNGDSLSKGNNTAAWNLKNSNGATVASGLYKVEVQATVDGDTVRKVVSVAVNR